MKRQRRSPTRTRNQAKQVDPGDTGELIGRRTGQGAAALRRATARPEKVRRDAYVDTSLPGVSASDRKAGGDMTARRNSKARAPKAASALEDSRTRPSRKSTRRSANRAKSGQAKTVTVMVRATSPSARAGRRG
jgi:pimeloyl-ACP methyl ester carboxylesterase